MKAIVLSAILSSFRSRKDKSIGFSVSTPELTTVEKVELMNLEQVNVRLLIEPSDYALEGKVEVKGELETKTPSERQRAVLFCRYKNEKPQGKTFADFYTMEMERRINDDKSKLPPME
jgi:hypothetical protein